MSKASEKPRRDRVLLVDDEPHILTGMKRDLRGVLAQNGLTPVTAERLDDAYIVINELGQRLLCVISDSNFPRGTAAPEEPNDATAGDILVRKLRDELPDVPVAVVTARAENLSSEVRELLGKRLFNKPLPNIQVLRDFLSDSVAKVLASQSPEDSTKE